MDPAMRRILLTSIVAGLLTVPAAAHEFWLSPERYEVRPGEAIEVRLRVGEKFNGASYVYNPNRFHRFEIIENGETLPVDGSLGDDPAMAQAASRAGLAVIVHETTDSTLTYTDWSKFTGFVAHKDFPTALDRHANRNLPETGFKESYRRYAKALIAVGSGAGSDQPVGLTTEIVAMANPYTSDLTAGMPLLVLAGGAPRMDAQLELFDRSPDGTVTVSLHRTNADGQVTVPVTPGHEYLADAVMLIALDNDDPAAGPVWHSDWAALTFAVPLR